MAIPNFNDDGILPEGIYEVSPNEIKEKFCNIVNCKHREKLFNIFFKYLNDLKSHDVMFELYMDGSFITNKEYPSDIDLVLIYDFEYSNEDWDLLINDDYIKTHYTGIQVFPAFLESYAEEEVLIFIKKVKGNPGKEKGILKVIL